MREGHLLKAKHLLVVVVKGSGLPHCAKVLFEMVSLQIFTRPLLVLGKQNKMRFVI